MEDEHYGIRWRDLALAVFILMPLGLARAGARRARRFLTGAP